MNLSDTEPCGQVHVLTLVPFEFEDDQEKTWCQHTRCSFPTAATKEAELIPGGFIRTGTDRNGPADIVDRKERTLRCKQCGSEIDPYLAIASIAHDWERWNASRLHAERRAKAAEQRLADLERDEQNCRARLRRLHQKETADTPADLDGTSRAKAGAGAR